MSTYSSMWSNRLRSGGYYGRLLMTYSSPFFRLKILRFLDFLAGFYGTLLNVTFGIWQGFNSELLDGSERKIDHFCSLVDDSSMREIWYRSGSRWYSSISRTTSKLLVKGRIIWMNGEGFLWYGWKYGAPK